MWKGWPSIKSKPMNLEFEIPTNKTNQFWEYIEQGEFRTTRCRSCGSLNFPPVADCVECDNSDLEWIALDGRGEVVAFTHVIARPASFQDFPGAQARRFASSEYHPDLGRTGSSMRRGN